MGTSEVTTSPRMIKFIIESQSVDSISRDGLVSRARRSEGERLARETRDGPDCPYM